MTDDEEAFEFSYPVRVYYEDTDAGGIVYHANYLKFMERARTEWLRAIGFDQSELRQEENLIFVVHRADVKFIAPAIFDDHLTVEVAVTRRRRASLELKQRVVRSDAVNLCEGIITVACVNDSTLKPAPLPRSLLERMDD